jgi:hypothetical protein
MEDDMLGALIERAYDLSNDYGDTYRAALDAARFDLSSGALSRALRVVASMCVRRMASACAARLDRDWQARKAAWLAREAAAEAA